MLVVCPECEAKISDMSDPCPHCGLPHAGHSSREYVERRAKKWDGELYPSEYVNCKKCGSVKGANYTKVRTKIVKSDYRAGYELHFVIPCPSCGRLIETSPGLI